MNLDQTGFREVCYPLWTDTAFIQLLRSPVGNVAELLIILCVIGETNLRNKVAIGVRTHQRCGAFDRWAHVIGSAIRRSTRSCFTLWFISFLVLPWTNEHLLNLQYDVFMHMHSYSISYIPFSILICSTHNVCAVVLVDTSSFLGTMYIPTPRLIFMQDNSFDTKSVENWPKIVCLDRIGSLYP